MTKISAETEVKLNVFNVALYSSLIASLFLSLLANCFPTLPCHFCIFAWIFCMLSSYCWKVFDKSMNTHTHTHKVFVLCPLKTISTETPVQCALCIDPAHYVLIVYIKVLMRWKLKSNLYNAFLRGV